jgi:hypothetical protein
MRSPNRCEDVLTDGSEVPHHLKHLRDKLGVNVLILKSLIKFVHASSKHREQRFLAWAQLKFSRRITTPI